MPIYIYVKTHNKTGLKYLGKTTAKNPHTYTGSGAAWKHHLSTYGKDYTTDIIRECQTKEELTEWGIYFSKLWNVVKSAEWANLKIEAGDGGELTAETRKKISLSNTGKTASKETREKMSASAKGRTFSEETRKKISNANIGKVYRSGHSLSEETRKKISSANTGNKGRIGQPHSEETKRKISEKNKGRVGAMSGKTHSEETKRKMSVAYNQRKKEK